MAVSRLKTWASNEVLTSSDLNAEFNNILNNDSSLGWPATANKDLDGYQLILDGDADSYLVASTDDRLDIRLGGSTLFRLDGTVATPVNGLDFIASAAGSAVRMTAVGSDTDISINLVPKGAGVLQVGGSSIFTNPMTTRGDIIYRNATVPARLAIGTSGYYLKSDGTDPAWAAPFTVATMTTRGDLIRRGASAPERVALGTDGQFLRSDGTDVVYENDFYTLQFQFDGGGAAITANSKLDFEIPVAGVITQATCLADQSGSIVFDVWVDTYANYPPTVADTITASAKPTISSATKAQDSTLTGWTTTLAAGSTMRVNVDSITTITRCVLSLKVRKT